MEKDNKISLFINSLRGGGAEKVCVTIANKLSKEGWKIDLIVLNTHNAVYINKLHPNINLVNLKTNHARNSFFKIKRYIQQNNPHKFLVFNHQLAIVLVFIRFVYKSLNYVIISRNISSLVNKRKLETSFWHKYIVGYLTVKMFNRVDLVISQSEGMKLELINHYSIPKEKIIVINNPVNQLISEKLNTLKEIENKILYILFVGRLSPVKGVDNILKVHHKCLNSIPNLELHILGDGKEKKNLHNLAKKLGTDKLVKFMGFSKDVTPHFFNASVTVLASKYEGFPNVLLESITIGTPIVAFDCQHGPSEIIKEGVNGYLIEENNIEMMAEKIIHLLLNPIDREKVKQTSLKYQEEVILEEYKKAIALV